MTVAGESKCHRPVAHREVPLLDDAPRSKLRDSHVFADDEILQPGIALWRYLIEWRTKHGDRAAAALYGRRMGDCVDAQRPVR